MPLRVAMFWMRSTALSGICTLNESKQLSQKKKGETSRKEEKNPKQLWGNVVNEEKWAGAYMFKASEAG